MTKEELISKRDELKKKLWDIEKVLKNKAYVSSVDFSSMYPSIIRLLNASIENLVGFIDNDPIAYRKLGNTDLIKHYEEKSKEVTKSRELEDSKYMQFVGRGEDRIALRLDLYKGMFDEAEISEICETPFERYFLALMYEDETEIFKFKDMEFTAKEFQQYLKDENLSISGSGAIYRAFKEGIDDPDRQGLIPSYLAYLFKERKKVKKEMLKHYRNKLLLQKFLQAAEEDGLFD